MSKRDEWVFKFPSVEVAKASDKKATFHTHRRGEWMAELDKAEFELKERGVKVRQMPVSGGYRAEAVVQPQLLQRVSECQGKMDEHRRLVERYEAFARALTLAAEHGTMQVDLDVNDIEFFGL